MKKLFVLLFVSTLIGSKTHAQTEVTFYTSMGNFPVMLTDTLTPVTVDSFKSLVSRKFYDGLIFHRVIDNFMIQGGDPTGTGMGGPGWKINDEFHPSLKNIPGTLSMANAGPNTNGSQFFINLVVNSHLDNRHTVFGNVTSNFEVVQKIGKVPTAAMNKPVTNVTIDSIRITKYPAIITKLSDNITVKTYPTTARGVYNAELPDSKLTVEVLSSTGESVYKKKAKGKLTIDLKDKPAGNYTLRITGSAGTGESKIILP